MTPTPLFNRQHLTHQRNRYAKTIANHDFILQLGVQRLADRWNDFQRKPARILELGAYTNQLFQALTLPEDTHYVKTDLSLQMVKQHRPHARHSLIVADEEYLPFAAQSFDLIVSNLNLHWVNDLPGCLIQIRHLLKPDGLFLACMFGGQTLKELRHVFMTIEDEQLQKIYPRISPFTDVKTAGMLLQRAGFDASVADSDVLTVTYPDVSSLLRDIRQSAQANILSAGRHPLHRRTLALLNETYRRLYPAEDGQITVTFELIYLTGLGI